MADWSSLPRDLVGKISGHLQSSIDLLRFRSVCSSWRSFATPPSPGDRSILFDGIEAGTRCYLTKRSVFLVSPPDSTTASCWIVKFKGQDNGSKRLLCPFARYPLNYLPSNFPRPFDFINFRIRELGVEHAMHVSKLGSQKTVLYCNKVAVVWINEGSDFLLLTTTDSYSFQLAFYSSVEKKWTVFWDGPSYSDVKAHNGKLYALDFDGNAVCVGPSAQLDLIATSNSRAYRKVLVESRGQLLLVFLDPVTENDRHKPMFQSARVFKVDEESRSWIPVHCLDDQVFVFGTDLTFSAADVPGCSGNLMLFMDRITLKEATGLEAEFLLGLNSAVLEWGTRSAKLLSSCPEYAKMFWPPPDWVSSASLEVEIFEFTLFNVGFFLASAPPTLKLYGLEDSIGGRWHCFRCKFKMVYKLCRCNPGFAAVLISQNRFKKKRLGAQLPDQYINGDQKGSDERLSFGRD